VVGLNLEDIDWRTGLVNIRGKGGSSPPLPLPTDVGKALAGYLREDRPRCSTRRVFVRDRAPLTGLGNSSTMSSLVRRALAQAGIESPHMGAHVLRHYAGFRTIPGESKFALIGGNLANIFPA
jgi:integrase